MSSRARAVRDCRPDAGCGFKPGLTARNDAVQELLFSGRLIEFYTRFFGEP